MSNRVSILACCLAALLFCSAPRHLDAEEGHDEAARAAFEVTKAVDAGDTVALGKAAAAIVPDRWLVADQLCLRSRHDAAVAYAQAIPAPEGPALVTYLQERGTTPAHQPSRAALEAAAQAGDAVKRSKAMDELKAVMYDGDAYEQARVRLALGRLQEEGHYASEALVTLEGAGQAADTLGWIQGAADAWSTAGFAAWAEYEADAARRAWEKQFQAEDRRASVDGCALALNNLGALAVALGDFRGAEVDLGRALEILKRVPAGAVIELQRSLLTNLAQAALRGGHVARAAQLVDQALASFEDGESPAEYASCLAAKADVLERLGDSERALELFEQVEALQTRLYETAQAQDPQAVSGASLELARARAARGALLTGMGRAAEALPILEAARSSLRDLGSKDEGMRVDNNLGLALRAVGRPEDAKRAFQAAIEAAKAIGDRWEQANTLQNLAELQVERGEPGLARAAHQEALALAEALRAPSLRADGNGGLARVHLALGAPSRALVHAERGGDDLVVALSGLAMPRGPQARERSAATFEAGVEAALRLDDAAAAMRMVERGRAATLLQALQGREELRDVIVESGELLKKERDAERAVAQARSLMERAETDARTGATLVSRERGKERYQRFKEELGRALQAQSELTEAALAAERTAATLLHGKVDSLEVIQGRLVPGDVLVSYASTRTGLVAVVVKPAKGGAEASQPATLVDLGSQAELAAAMDEIDWNDAAEAIPATRLAALRDRLLTPLKLPTDTRRLLISPAGPLALVPFSALLPEGVQVPVSYLPSGTTYGLLLDEAGRRGERVLGVGGPDYTGRLRLPRLDGSAKEVAAITAEKDRMLGAAATETALRARLAAGHRWRALHIACHGLADPVHPLRSALALTRGDDPTDDGYLTALEVLRLKVPADLTVLSACVTGKGRYFRGEGLIGLPWAFFVAGSPRVIASLWQVDDAATLALMEAFYGFWLPKDPKQAPLPVAEALRRAQAVVRQTPGWEHPYYWAAWVLWGLPE